MKKLLASLLAMVMALSLAAPAFADDTPPLIAPAPGEDPPSGWTADAERAELAERLGISAEAEDWYLNDETWEWLSAHEKEAKEFLDSGMDGHIQTKFGFDSLEDLAEVWSFLDAPVLFVLEDWVQDQQEAEKYAAFRTEHPDLAAQFAANAYDYFDACEGDGWSTVKEYMEGMGLHTEAEFVEKMVNAQIDDYMWQQDRQKELDEFEAAHPGMIAWYRANAYDYFAQHYVWYDSPQEFMADYELTEEEFVESMMMDQVVAQQLQDAERQRIDREKAELGGVPGQTGVMIDGKYVKFPDAAPEVVRGRTMAPLRAVMEALGAEVTYNGNDDIRCTVNGVEYAFAVGSTGVKLRYVEWDGEGDAPDMEGLIMDCAPYIRNGRTYVPVRFFAEAFGYTVEWDQNFQTAVLTDKDKLIADIDKDFTLVNRLLSAGKSDAEDSRRLNCGCAADLTLFNSLDGDTQSGMSFSADLLASPAGASGTVKYDLSQLLDLFLAQYGAQLLDEADEEQIALLKTLLTGTAEVRYDAGTETAYLRIPALSALSALMEQLGADVPRDAWFSLDLGGMSDLMTGMDSLGMGEDATVGALIAASMGDFPVDPVYARAYALRYAGTAAAVIGDGKFVRKGDAMTMTLDAEGLFMLMTEPDGSTPEDMPREFSVELAVHDGGTVDVSYVYRSPASYYSPDMRVAVKGSYGPGKTDLSVEYHVKNQMKAIITVKQSETPAREQPQTEPPEGSEVIPMNGTAYPDGLDPDFAIPMEPAA